MNPAEDHNLAAQVRNRLDEALWRAPGAGQPRWKLGALRILRTLAVLFRDAMRGQLTLRAMSLVYTTLLSLVPLLALSFSVLKAFGVHNQIQPFLDGVLAPLGEQGQEVTRQIIGFIENMNVGVLGSMGLALLAYTAVSLIQKIEESFNFIWHVVRPRSFGERFSRYLSLLLIGPLLVFAALGITATVTNADLVRDILAIEPFGQLYFGLTRLMPYLLVIAAFTFTYHFVPNTAVEPTAALLGGIVAGIAWQSAGWGFAEFVATSTRYQAIYSSFAVLILFMIWLYLSWLILLLGASVAFYYQHPEYLVARSGEPRLSNRMRERLALAVTSCVAGRFRSGGTPLSADGLVHRLKVPAHAVQIVLDALERHGLIARTENAAYLPTRNLAAISVDEILKIVRSADEEHYLRPDDLPLPPRVAEVLQHVDEALDHAVAEMSLDDIADLPADLPADLSPDDPDTGISPRHRTATPHPRSRPSPGLPKRSPARPPSRSAPLPPAPPGHRERQETPARKGNPAP